MIPSCRGRSRPGPFPGPRPCGTWLLVFLILQAPEGLAFTVPELVTAVRVAIGENPGSREAPPGVSRALSRFLQEPELPSAALRPHPGLDVTTYLLHVEPHGSFSIAVLVLRSGVEGPIHDHGSWAVWGVVAGRDRETRYTAHPGGDGFPDLRVSETLTLPDDGVSLIPAPPGDIHRVENLGGERSVSVHVHGADMSRVSRKAYQVDRRAVVSFLQSYERLGETGEKGDSE